MKLMFSKSSVAQSACCLLKALKAKLLIVTPLDSALFSSFFTLLYHVLSFSSLSPLTLSHCSPGKWGANYESFLGYDKVCVCVCVRPNAHTCVFHVWFRRVGCETWDVGREREEQQQPDTESTGQWPSSLSLFSSSCPWGDTTAAPDTEQHPLTDTQRIRLIRLIMPHTRVKGPQVVCVCYRTTSYLYVSVNQMLHHY